MPLSDFRSCADGISEIDKAPHADLDYYEDWTSWLASGETIVAVDWEVPTGLTKGIDAIIGGLVEVWLSGGAAGTDYLVSATIHTSQAREDTRSFRVRCRLR